jgi:hypothetical protein
MATITVTELATTLDAPAREVRKFLRSVTPDDAQPGKGGRWAIEKREVRSLTKKFAEFEAAKAIDTPDDADDAELDDAPAQGDDTSE